MRAANGDERHGPFLPKRGYEDEAQCDINPSLSPLLKHYRNIKLLHIPPDLVVDQWASDGERSSHRPFLFRYNVWTMFRRQIREKITLTLSMSWHFTTKSGGIWPISPRRWSAR